MEFILSLFASVVIAAESILSPLADDFKLLPKATPTIVQPRVSFGSLVGPTFAPLPTPATSAAVLGLTTSPTPTATPTPALTYQTRKPHYAIALIGDSMVDTLGPDVPHLKRKLLALFPNTTFTILNYGVGASNIDLGVERLTNSYTYLGKPMPSLVSQAPDIVIVESFGYNPYPFEAGALEKHWLQMANIVHILRERLPSVQVMMAATIAPNSQLFGDGAPGIAFSAKDKQERTKTIKQYLDSTVKFAESQGLPIANAFHPSLMANGDGNSLYINGGDHIHYSEAGRELMAQKIAETIVSERLLQ
jgi:lysophospholipase L1-like esterase